MEAVGNTYMDLALDVFAEVREVEEEIVVAPHQIAACAAVACGSIPQVIESILVLRDLAHIALEMQGGHCSC